MGASFREKMWAAEKKAPQKSPTEREPFHGVKSARAILCAPQPDRTVDEREPYQHPSERELYFSVEPSGSVKDSGR